jgi:hypothetical protein
MTMAELRDLIIIIAGIVGMAGIVIIVVLAFKLYARLKPILDSIEKATKAVARVTSGIEEAVGKPLTQILSFVQGVRSALGFVKKFTGKEDE